VDRAIDATANSASITVSGSIATAMPQEAAIDIVNRAIDTESGSVSVNGTVSAVLPPNTAVGIVDRALDAAKFSDKASRTDATTEDFRSEAPSKDFQIDATWALQPGGQADNAASSMMQSNARVGDMPLGMTAGDLERSLPNEPSSTGANAAPAVAASSSAVLQDIAIVGKDVS